MVRLGMLISLLGTLLMIVGGFSCVALFVYGAYALFAESVNVGLKAIGAAVVAGILIRLLSGMLMAGGGALSVRAAEAAAMRESRGQTS
jgi:hypothetical protein